MNEKMINYIEESFLKDLLKFENLTDISFNGKDIYYVTNNEGRMKSTISIDNDQAYAFIRQIANLSDSQFSFSDPILDVSFGKYRINATHFAISRKNREKVVNFSIRIGNDELRIKENDGFVENKCLKLIDLFIKNKYSIVIGGITGVGKTEFQKFLISRFIPHTRVIVIDNLNEVENDFYSNDLDIQSWVINEQLNNLTFESSIKNALRAHPDWIILSEARGKEMVYVLNSSMSGHPTITTIHSKDVNSIYSRMARLCLQSGDNLKYDNVLNDIYDHFKLCIQLKSFCEENGSVIRYVDSILTNVNEKIELLYSDKKYFKINEEIKGSLTFLNDEFIEERNT